MTVVDAMQLIENERECVSRADRDACDRVCEVCDLVKPAADIFAAYSMAIDALARQMPTKPTVNWTTLTASYRCSCGVKLNTKFKYCPGCGQRIDWA